MQNYTPAPRYEDEISLTDLFLGLRSHWRGMLAAFMLVLMVGIAFASVWPAKYAYTAVLSIGGQVNESGFQPVESAGDVEAALTNAYIPAVVHQLGAEHDFFPRISVDTPKSGGVVVLKATGPAKVGDDIQAMLTAASQRVIDRHDKQMAARKDAVKASYAGRLEALKERINTLNSGLEASGLNAADKAQMQDQLADLKQQRVSLQEQMNQSLAAFQKTTLAHPPQRSIEPVGLGALAIMLLSGVLAAMLALGVGLLLMFADAVRERERELAAERNSRENGATRLEQADPVTTRTRVA